MMIPPETQWGPAMKALPGDAWRAFVMAMVNTGGKNHTECLRLAGYEGDKDYLKVRAHLIVHDPRTQAAIQEVGRSRFRSLTLDATLVLAEAMTAQKAIVTKDGVDGYEPDWTTRVKAANSVLDRGGLHALSEHHVTVTKTLSREEKIMEIAKLAKMLGKDPKDLLGNMADAIEGDFETIKEIEHVEGHTDTEQKA